MSFYRLAFFLWILVPSHDARAVIVAVHETETASQVATKVRHTLDNRKKAALEAQRMAEADPSETNLFVYASTLMKLDYHSAEIIWRFAVNKYPGSVRLHAGLASALEGLGDRDGAAAELCTTAELAPTDPHPLEFLVAAEYIPQALSQKVAEGLRELHRRYPRDGLIFFDYEMARSNRYADPSSPVPPDFVPMLKQVIRLTPRLPEAYFQLSRVYDQRQAFAHEVQALRQAVQLAPQNRSYRYHLAMAYRQLGSKDDFLRQMSIFQTLSKQSSSVELVH